MFILHGKRDIQIKKYAHHQNYCERCNSLDLEVSVYQSYFHLFFIPFFPVGRKTAQIHCNNCSDLVILDSVEKQYKDSTKTPWYFFSGLILIGVLIIAAAIANQATQKEKAKFVAAPKVDDVYKIRNDRNDTTSYYFLRITRINGDSVFVMHNDLVYYKFITRFNADDYFVKDEELLFTKKELKEMLDKGEINAVERDYPGSFRV